VRGESVELQDWLRKSQSKIAQRWRARIRHWEGRRHGEGDGFLGVLCDTLVSYLPHCLGDTREDAEKAWDEATHLYGSLALKRGLAAGEVVEELEVLREEILRLLLEAPPGDWGDKGFHREFLALNQVLDTGVVRANVAYVDDLFFAHLQGSGVPGDLTPELEEEMLRQLEASRKELNP
jgi:hypothetical protein